MSPKKAATNEKTSSQKNAEEKRPRSPSPDASKPAEEGGKRAKFLVQSLPPYQLFAKPDFTAQIVLPDVPYTRDGVASSQALCDPMECVPYDLSLEDIKAVDKLSYTAHQKPCFLAHDSDMESGPVVTANTGIIDGGCGIQTARGKFIMKRVWTEANPDGSLIELFERFFSLMISYSSLYKRKGYGSGDNTEFAFWAVRARKDVNGKEIDSNLGS